MGTLGCTPSGVQMTWVGAATPSTSFFCTFFLEMMGAATPPSTIFV